MVGVKTAPSAARRVVGRIAVAVVISSRALLRILLCALCAPLLWFYAGCTAVIQPGGSVRDQEVIEAANDAGLAMVFTGERHFKH